MQNLRNLISMIVLVLATALAIGAHAEEVIYKWVDEFGVTHFAAQPPDGVDYERVSGRMGARPQPSSASRVESTERATGPGSSLPMMEERTVRVDPEELAAQCDQARSNLARLAQRGPIRLRNEDGTETALDADARAAFVVENQAFIDEWC